jgi:hypothetical protein
MRSSGIEGEKVKVPRGNVLLSTTYRVQAANFVARHAPKDVAVHFSCATAGARGTATAGYAGTATAGDAGTATAGARGTATAGYAGTATAGDDGFISIAFYDGQAGKYRYARSPVGHEQKCKPGVAYVVRDGELVAKEPQS